MHAVVERTPDTLAWVGSKVEHRNLAPARLVEQAIFRGEGELAESGALVFRTGQYTGRSPEDKFIVFEPSVEAEVDWGKVNRPFEPAKFDALLDRVLAHLANREIWIEDAFGGTDPAHRLPIRVVCERAYHALFARQLFVKASPEELAGHRAEFTIIAAPDFQAIPERDGTRSEVFILLNFARRIALIGGTLYAGEIKKSVFSILNTLLPGKGVLPMHCSANVGQGGDVALFFGLSGTGKTTLSADPTRGLIGDDEHGWSDSGVFNFEGGCYAKCIRLDPRNEPEIYAAIKFGTVLENVVLDPITHKPDFVDATLTENTRAAYPIDFIANHVPSGRAGHPKHIVFLTCDAFGVLPPLSRLTPEQAMYHFLSGYTAKVAGTERGLRALRRLQHLLRRTVHDTPAPTLRRSTRAKAPPASSQRLAPQHRLDRRRIRPGPTDQPASHQSPGQRDHEWRIDRGGLSGRSNLRPRKPHDLPRSSLSDPRPANRLGRPARL
jgi:phosphoenolpyruvate carboxykinase (ATP)